MTRWAICPTCEGNGTHVNPAIDGHGITAEEMYELGDDFREDYMRGVYDVSCEECKGMRVVPACSWADDEGSCDAPVLFLDGTRFDHCSLHLDDDEEESAQGIYEDLAMYRMERMMGA